MLCFVLVAWLGHWVRITNKVLEVTKGSWKKKPEGERGKGGGGLLGMGGFEPTLLLKSKYGRPLGY